MQRKEPSHPADDSPERDDEPESEPDDEPEREDEPDNELEREEREERADDRDAVPELPEKRLDIEGNALEAEGKEPVLVDIEPPGISALETWVSDCDPVPAGRGKFDCCDGGAEDTEETIGTARG